MMSQPQGGVGVLQKQRQNTAIPPNQPWARCRAGQLLPVLPDPVGVRWAAGGEPSDRQVLAGFETQSPQQQPCAPGLGLTVTLGFARS